MRQAPHALWLALFCACKSAPPKAPIAAPAVDVSAQPPPVLAQAPMPPILLRDVGFASPRAAIHDAEADVYLVSNVNGGPADVDGNGFISRVAPDGTLLELRWIDGAAGGLLDAPKGMALDGDKLYVADLNVVRSFDRKSGQPLGKVAILSASYLNGLAIATDGTLFVSDTGLTKSRGPTELQNTGSDAIYSLDARGSVGVLFKGIELGQPSGLLADTGGVWVVNTNGELVRISHDGALQTLGKLPGGNLEGLVQTENGRLVISCAATSTVYIGKPPPSPAGAFEPLITDLESPADLGYDRRRHQLLVPLTRDNALYIQQIPTG